MNSYLSLGDDTMVPYHLQVTQKGSSEGVRYVNCVKTPV